MLFKGLHCTRRGEFPYFEGEGIWAMPSCEEPGTVGAVTQPGVIGNTRRADQWVHLVGNVRCTMYTYINIVNNPSRDSSSRKAICIPEIWNQLISWSSGLACKDCIARMNILNTAG